MNKLKIPENHSGISKTLRLPENIVEDVQNLANLKIFLLTELLFLYLNSV